MRCPERANGVHCDCPDARSLGICCYCHKKLTPDPPDTSFDDDGSEENNDA